MKVAVCIPCHGDPKLAFMVSLGQLLLHTVKAQIGLIAGSSATLPGIRQSLVKAAITGGADYILWLDADHTFPPDALARLLSHDLDVVGANYAKRLMPEQPTASLGPGLWFATTRELAEKGALTEVDAMGLGLCLMKTSVFSKIEKPYFLNEPSEDGENFVGEDYYLFRKLGAAGVKIFVDHQLSWSVGHISQTILTNAGTKGTT
jgi:hypothetical protein